MNKEKIITIVIGLSVGILVTAGYFGITNLLPKVAKKEVKIIVQPQTPVPVPVAKMSLLISKPDDKSSTASATTTIVGKTVPGGTLVLFSNADEKIASADAFGNFTSLVKLEPGENEISVTAFLGKTNSEVIHRNVTLEISQ